MLQNMLIPPTLFFALGLLARLIKSDLKFPGDVGKAASIYLLVGIGLHGGIEMGKAQLSDAAASVLAAVVLGVALPLIAFVILRGLGRIDRLNAAAVAAHYGSVSAGTFLTAIAFLDTHRIAYETFPLIMLAIMESPAIVIGLLLARWGTKPAGDGQGGGLGHVLRDAFTNGSVVLLFGSILIGLLATPDGIAKIMPLFDTMFMGVLCLFLLELGLEAAKRMGEFRRVGLFLTGFGLAMPLIGGTIGVLVGHYALGFGVGGSTLVAVLTASASYIAVPSAMRLAIPEANPSFYLTLSLGVTFPFNVVFGISIYYYMARWIAGP